MAIRNIINIDEDKCNGCGQCIISCQEAALQIVNSKARLIKDIYCDGLGACIGSCPTGALTLIQREADPFDEKETEKHVHEIRKKEVLSKQEPCACPSLTLVDFSERKSGHQTLADVTPELKNWPIQLKLISTKAPYLQNSDLLLAADCTAFSTVNFQSRFIKGKKQIIACPKLDNAEFYYEKLTEIFKENSIKSIVVVRMEVPCCGGLIHIAKEAIKASKKNIPLKEVIIGIKGEVLQESSIPL